MMWGYHKYGGLWNLIGAVYDDGLYFYIVILYIKFYFDLTYDLDCESVLLYKDVHDWIEWSN